METPAANEGTKNALPAFPVGAVLVGGVGWWLLGAALLAGPCAGIGEPYGTWVSAQQGMAACAIVAPMVSFVYFLPLGLLPGLLVVFLGWLDRRRGKSARDFGPAAGWLLSAWACVPIAFLRAPFAMIREAAWQIHDPAEVPAWTRGAAIQLLGHERVGLTLLVVSLVVASFIVTIVPVRVGGAIARLCWKCRYDRAGLPADAPCPECGLLSSTALPRTPWVKRQWSLARRHPARLLASAGAIAAAAWLGTVSWRFAHTHQRHPSITQIICFVSVLLGAVMITAMARSASARARARSLALCLLLVGMAGAVWIAVTRLAELTTVALYPNASPRSHPWWFFETLNEHYLVPSLLVVAVCWWMGWCVPRYIEDEL